MMRNQLLGPRAAYFAQVKHRSDRLTNYFLVSYFAIGLFLASYYDTWTVAIGVGAMALAAYYGTKLLLPKSVLYQYVLSTVVGVFMAQFIYQMHGMFEMHFFAFIGSTILITYQNWRLQVPLAVFVVLHHAGFGYLQFIGVPEVYFTELEYMELPTFIIHVVLAAVIFFLCGLWAFTFRRSSLANIEQSYAIGKLQEANLQKEAMLRMREDLDTSHRINKDMTDSIRYTQRLQQAMLPDAAALNDYFADSFVFNRPHSIVGGDFVWFQPTPSGMLVACVDCTGHGVPGAFMSIIAVDLLKKIAHDHAEQAPAVMLQKLDEALARAIGSGTREGVMDGMDMVLCHIDLDARRIRFAGAMNPILLATAEGVSKHRGSGYGLGAILRPEEKTFETHEISFNEGDVLYMYSDGYVDQFGGPHEKRLRYVGLEELIEEVRTLPMHEQHVQVAHKFDTWKGDTPQTDDTLVIGLKLQRSASAAAVKAA